MWTPKEIISYEQELMLTQILRFQVLSSYGTLSNDVNISDLSQFKQRITGLLF